MKRRDNRRRHLNDQPTDDAVGGGNFINVASLQLGEKITFVHLVATIFSRSYLTFGIFTILPFACWSFGSLTTVTYNSLSSFPNATFVVPSPAAISNTARSFR